jgi:hypothetical protein
MQILEFVHAQIERDEIADTIERFHVDFPYFIVIKQQITQIGQIGENVSGQESEMIVAQIDFLNQTGTDYRLFIDKKRVHFDFVNQIVGQIKLEQVVHVAERVVIQFVYVVAIQIQIFDRCAMF